MSEFSPFSAEMSAMALAVTKIRIKEWCPNRRSAQSLLPARLPAGRCFVGQPPAVRAALRPEM